MHYIISFVLAIWETVITFQPSMLSSVSPDHAQHHSIWDRISPSTHLHFHSCYGTFECARFDVPLDWKNESTNSQRAAVALIRLPANVGVGDPRYGGSILINPGGPGGSGINLVRLHGNNLQRIVDSPLSPDDVKSTVTEKKYFDIIGFDPRGVGFTTPSFSCFADAQQRLLWQVASDTDGLLGSSGEAFSRMWARKKAIAETCSIQSGDDGIGTRMNTPIVAMDMAAIVEALARWRNSHLIRGGSINTMEKPSPTPYKLQYWGFSYGTLLGETFASMYPHLVGRMVLDGVVDSDRHYAGTWDGNLKDADAIMDRFSIYCFQAGRDKCHLFSEKGPKHIHSLLDDFLALAENTSQPVPSAHGPEIVTYSDVQKLIRDSLYEPFKTFHTLSEALYNFAHGNSSIIANRKQTAPSQKSFFEPPDYAEEVVGAISCSDGLDQSNTTKGEFMDYWLKMRHESVYLGDRWSQNRLLCLFWKLRSKVNYSGPIGVPTEPILFIGNTLDPVTSVDNAKKMSHRFPGSALLQQDSEGHLSLSTPSLCTAKAVRRYFQSGILPTRGSLCPVYDKPFDLPGDRTMGPLDLGDYALLKALRSIACRMW